MNIFTKRDTHPAGGLSRAARPAAGSFVDARVSAFVSLAQPANGIELAQLRNRASRSDVPGTGQVSRGSERRASTRRHNVRHKRLEKPGAIREELAQHLHRLG
jgi:hypothetical protein